jgi:hypothetical protein
METLTIYKASESVYFTDKSKAESYENNLNDLKEKIKKEIIENHSKKFIFFSDQSFPKNHLYCKRKANYEYVEHQNSFDVYIYPPIDAIPINLIK